jgi:uncharacterized protein YodC (DUF2158 family)
MAELFVFIILVLFAGALLSGGNSQRPGRWPVAAPGQVAVGDQVQLLSGGPVMTVAAVESTSYVRCTYFIAEGKHLQHETVPVAILRVKPTTRVIA